MFKKIIFSILLLTSIIPVVSASSTSAAKIGNKYYDTLEEAINEAGSTDTISLTSNVKSDDTININKVVNIDLNGKNITAPSTVFMVDGGNLTVSGKGIIKETDPNYGAIMVKGSNSRTNDKYSTVTIEKDVTLEGWSGIFINHNSGKAHGVNVYLHGKINAVNDTNGDTGVGVYVNGNIKHEEEAPVVTIYDDARITSTGVGLYIAGYSNFSIRKAYIEGIESGIAIKSGILQIDGATVVCSGSDKTPTEGYNNGVNPSGTTVQIESHNGYAGNIELNIDSGTFTSKNSNVIYEYIGKGTNTQVTSIDISGGTFESESGKDVFQISNSLKNNHSTFISGGKYSSNPDAYLKSGYKAVLNNDFYTVTQSTSKEVTGDSITSSTQAQGVLTKSIILIAVIVLLVALFYFNRNKILRIFK